MISQEDVGEVVLEALEKCYHDLILLEDSEIKDMSLWLELYKQAVHRYETAIANVNFYYEHLEEW
jgi:hypothetical protein